MGDAYMKRIAIALFCVTAIGPIQAEDQVDWRETCDGFSEHAELIMQARQLGISMAEAMGKTDSKVHEEMIIAAYEKPRYSTDRMQQKAIEDFRDHWYLRCAKSIRE